MPLNKLSNFIKNVEGRILYVNPNDLDATDSIDNQGNSLASPFRTIQRALLEAARFSYVKGNNNDIVEKTTILLFPGEHIVDNRPGFAIYDNSGAKVVTRSGAEFPAQNVLTLNLESIFDLTQDDNILYKFNSFYGGVIVPRGTSIVGLDLRKTKIRPKYVPNPTDSRAKESAIFRITGACYFWQFSIFDGDETGTVYTDPDNFSDFYKSIPTFSHHKLTCFEYADGVNKIGNYNLTDLDMYYSKVANAFNEASGREIKPKFPEDNQNLAKQLSEWQIVGAFETDPLKIEDIYAGNRTTASSIVTVKTRQNHNFNAGTPIKIRGVNDSTYNISTKVQTVLSPTEFTYLLPSFPINLLANPGASLSGNETVTVETDTVSGASPYIFNCSLRSVWGMNGMVADGRKASGFRSMVVAQFTAVSLQKDDRAFVKYNKKSRTYNGISISPTYGGNLSSQSSSTNTTEVYHLDSDAIYRNGWESSHIKISNNAFIQIVSVFAIGFNKHFDVQSGGDASITNSNSNFGQISLSSDGFRDSAFVKDNNAFITSIVPPREIDSVEEDVQWVSIDVAKTIAKANSSRLYLNGFISENDPPTSITQGYRIGAKISDKIYLTINDVEYSASILMSGSGIFSSFKEYNCSPADVDTSIFTISSGHQLQTGEKVILISDSGDLPENIQEHRIYYVIYISSTQIKLASSLSNAVSGQEVNAYLGSNIRILSRVSDKYTGEIGSPIQFDTAESNWYLNVNSTNNTIYDQIVSLGVAGLSETTDLTYIKRTPDSRSLDEKIYKIRVVIPKEAQNAKNPETGFVIQESSSTGVRFDSDFTTPTITSADFDYKKNPKFISTCTSTAVGDGTVNITVTSELAHNLRQNDIVIIKNVVSSENLIGLDNLGYNGTFRVSAVNNTLEFVYNSVDIFGTNHIPGSFTSNTNIRSRSLPRFERNDLQSNLYIYRNEVISPYIEGIQDGIYYLYVLNANNSVSNEFTNIKYSQNPVNLYPELDRDNVSSNPRAAKTYARIAPLGDVVTSDLKKSITRESVDSLVQSFDLGFYITNVTSSVGISTITFNKNHGLNGIVNGTITGGSGYNSGTFYNVKLLNGGSNPSAGGVTWNGATAKVVVSGSGSNNVTSVEIISPGSGYTTDVLYFDQTKIGSGNGAARFTVNATTNDIGEVVQITGSGTQSDSHYRIINIPSANQISIANTIGDIAPVEGQYSLLTGPSIVISSVSYNSSTGISTFTTSSPHGLLKGNKFTAIQSNATNRGSYTVLNVDASNTTTFSAKTNVNLSSVLSSGYILKNGLDSNGETSDSNAENFGSRHITFYDKEILTATSGISTTATTISVSSLGGLVSLRIPLGSYIQIDNEIMRVSQTGNTTINVLRGSLGTRQESHKINSLIRKIKPIAIEFRRPSILRASGHTFEYLGYGPGNYSTAFPQIQVKTISERESFLVQAQERGCGSVTYNGINNAGDVFSGNTKTNSGSGEIVSYDIPKPTVTGEDPSTLSVVFDEVTIKQRLLVEGGNSGNVLSQFDGPVTFNQQTRFKDNSTFNGILKISNNTSSTSPIRGSLVINGGVGVGENLNVGGSLAVSGNTTLGDTSSDSLTINSIVTSNAPVTIRNIQIGVSDANTINTASGNLIIDSATDIVNINAETNINNTIKITGTSTIDGITNINNVLNVFDVINATTPNAGTSGGVRIKSNSTTGNSILQFIDSTLSSEFANITATTSSITINNTSGNLIILNDTTQINGDLNVTGDIAAFWTSDRRLKNNIKQIDNSLQKILKISGNTFEWNDKSNKTGNDVGLIAQEIYEILPEAVVERDTGYLAVDYYKIIPLLVESIKELSNKVNQLQDK